MNTEHWKQRPEEPEEGGLGGPITSKGPHPPLLDQSDVGFSSPPVQEKRDLTEPFVPLPGRSNVLGTRNPSLQKLQAPDSPGWALSSGSVPLLSSQPLCL